MTRHDDDNAGELHAMLSDHLRRRLDNQRGRSLAAFESGAIPTSTVTLRRRGPLRLAFATAGLIAASVAIAWAVWPRAAVRPTPPFSPVAAGVPSAAPRELERLVMWKTYDEGAGVLANQLPVRKLRQEGVEQVEFYLPDAGATVKVTVPVVRNVMLQMETY